MKFIVTPDMIGQNLIVTVREVPLRDFTVHVGQVGNNLVIFHSEVNYLPHNVNSSATPFPHEYAFSLGTSGLMQNGVNVTDNVIKVSKQTSMILWKRDNAGNLYRRIYKTDGIMFYVGSIQKDSEDCKKPSGIITIMDKDYLHSRGWEPYYQENSAEKTAKPLEDVKKTLNV